MQSAVVEHLEKPVGAFLREVFANCFNPNLDSDAYGQALAHPRDYDGRARERQCKELLILR